MLSTQAKDRLALWHACRGAPEIRVRQTGSTCTAVRARPSHICTATRLTATTSALRLDSPRPHPYLAIGRTRGRPIASGHRNQPTRARLERGSARPACNDDERAGAPALIGVRLRSDRKLGPALQQVVEARVARRRRSGRVGTRRAHCAQRQAKAPTGTGPSRQLADAPTDRPAAEAEAKGAPTRSLLRRRRAPAEKLSGREQGGVVVSACLFVCVGWLVFEPEQLRQLADVCDAIDRGLPSLAVAMRQQVRIEPADLTGAAVTGQHSVPRLERLTAPVRDTLRRAFPLGPRGS